MLNGDGIAALEIAAQAGDEVAFMRTANQIDWQQRPTADFVRAVHLALTAGAHLLARRLATRGAQLHPDHPELQKMARILAPPRVLRTDLPPGPSLRANQAWMRANEARYRGRWVALDSGVLLAHAPTSRERKQQLATTRGLFLTRML